MFFYYRVISAAWAVLICCAAFAEGVLAEPASVQDPIYVVDMQRVFSESIIGKAATNNLQEDVKKKQVVLEKQRLELEKLKGDLEKQASLLSKDALRKKEQQLYQKERDFERSLNDQREELALRNKDAMEKVLLQINKVMKDLADKNDYKIIMEKDLRVVVYANKKYDISDEVIKQLDNEHMGL